MSIQDDPPPMPAVYCSQDVIRLDPVDTVQSTLNVDLSNILQDDVEQFAEDVARYVVDDLNDVDCFMGTTINLRDLE